ncbi:MAG: branched-chain amino acid ABC transporter permease [Candidatus Nanopelagicales bacterium]
MLQDLVFAMSLGSIYLLFALGMSLVWGTIGILNFAHGVIFMFAAFVAYLISQEVTLGLPLLVLIGIAVGALMSVGIQLLAFEPILRRAKDFRTAELQILIGGIGVATIPLAIAQHETKSNPFGITTSFDSQTYEVFGVRISTTQIIIIVAAVVFSAALAIWLRRSRHGLALRAIGVDSETSSLMGANRARLAIGAMGLSGGLAGLAGVLLTLNLGAITPESGDALLVTAFAAVILGGVGSVLGVVVGSYALAMIETWVLVNTSGTWVAAVSFGIIFLVLLFRPQGLFGHAEVRRT